MRTMDLVADLLPAPNALSDADAAKKLASFRNALLTGDISALDATQRSLIDRIGQASQKIGSGAEIGRTSELMTLAQFGPASVGAAIALACDDAPAQPVAEALFVSRFLTEIVFAGSRFPALLPGDLLKQNQIERRNISWPAAAPVYRDLLIRADEAIERADAAQTPISSRPLQKMLARHRLETVRQIGRLHGRDPESASARLTGLDKLLVSFKLLLRIRGAS